jgi:hypothetical protein
MAPERQGDGVGSGSGCPVVTTRRVAFLALAIAVGHVIYAILRDHVFHGSPILSALQSFGG